MSLQSTPKNHKNYNICHILLSRKLVLLRIDQETKCTGLTEAYNHVLNSFSAAIIERNSPEEAVDIIHFYADQLQSHGKLEEMKQLYQRAIDDLKENFGPQHSSTIIITFRMGRLLRRLKELKDAESIFSQSLNNMTDQNSYALYFLHELGVVYEEQHKYLQAENAFQKALSGFTKRSGANPMWAYTAAINLGEVYRSQGKVNCAARMLRQGLLGVAKEFGMSHETITSKRSKLVKMYKECKAKGKWHEARDVCYIVMDTFEKIFGLDHPETQQVAWDLAEMLNSRPYELGKLIDKAGLSKDQLSIT